MEVYLNGKNKITLGQREFRGQGGEGAVYVRQGTAYKIYTDPQRVLPLGKMQELAPLTLPNIVKPESLLTDQKGVSIGYTMRAIPAGIPLCQSFNKAFRDRHRLNPKRVLSLVEQLRDGVRHVHERGILIVDLNEMNFLLAPDLKDVFFIDVDSYQTTHFPATAIMETVRDRQASAFTPGSDWFSFAVVSFQLFIGIHPFKGKHPTLKTLDERMRANASVLNPAVTMPNVCLPLTVLPKQWRDWYEAVLERGLRVPPPDGGVLNLSSFAPTPAPMAPVAGRLEFRTLGMFEGDILDAVGDLILTTQALYSGGRKLIDIPAGISPHLIKTMQSGAPVLAWLENERVHVREGRRGTDLPMTQIASEIASIDGRLYARQGDALLELTFVETPARLFAQFRPVGNVLEQATQLFPGVALQNLLGAWYASLLPHSGVCHQIRLPELDGTRLIDARFENGVLAVVTENKGAYDRVLFRFDDNYRTYDTHRTSDVDSPEIDMTVLDTGVCLLRDGDKLELFSRRKGDTSRMLVPDAGLGGACRLFSDGAQVRVATGDTLRDARLI